MRNARAQFQRITWAIFALALICSLYVTSLSAAGSQDPQRPDSYDSSSGVPAEKPKATPTAADRTMSQKIRKAIAADKSLSTDGHRVKVTTQDGKVTLQGAVRSEAERTSIFTKAADVAGGTNVANNITVSAQK
ncbi:MAG TPA: BON domain-containing protein [Candidatus Acidoferrum sp.]